MRGAHVDPPHAHSNQSTICFVLAISKQHLQLMVDTLLDFSRYVIPAMQTAWLIGLWSAAMENPGIRVFMWHDLDQLNY
mgnify:CR=1 FL=1